MPRQKLIKGFLYSASTLLAVVALAKLVSGFGTAQVLAEKDPLFNVSFRFLFRSVGLIELTVAIVGFYARRPIIGLACVAFLASNISFYRLALAWVGFKRPCPCLGTMTEAIKLPPEAADLGLKIVLMYLLAGSFWGIWLCRDKASSANSKT